MMKKTILGLALLSATITSIPANAALLVNWTTGSYGEMGWEVCMVFAANNPDYHCIGGLTGSDNIITKAQVAEVRKKINAGALVLPEPNWRETKKQLNANLNTSNSNERIAAPIPVPYPCVNGSTSGSSQNGLTSSSSGSSVVHVTHASCVKIEGKPVTTH
ncbi:MAG: hypothetical protein ACI97K_002154 [Glaciecola sp.]|jgi:hypothetical protein